MNVWRLSKPLSFLIFSLPILSNAAEVNLKDASLVHSEADIPGLIRTYNSRSLQSGVLGLGWCLNIEKRLSVRSKKSISIEECSGDKKNYTQYRLLKNEMYKVDGLNGGFEIYNKKGQMVELKMDSHRLLLDYNSQGRLQLIQSRDQKFIVVSDFDSKRWIGLVAKRQSIRYRYESGKLSEVSEGGKLKTKLIYDSTDNLIKIEYADGSAEAMRYNEDKDWIVSYTDRFGCVELYRYTNHESDKTIANLEKRCGIREVKQAQYEFVYKVKFSGEKFLDHVIVSTSKEKVEITYHPETGRPLKIQRYNHSIATISQGEIKYAP